MGQKSEEANQLLDSLKRSIRNVEKSITRGQTAAEECRKVCAVPHAVVALPDFRAYSNHSQSQQASGLPLFRKSRSGLSGSNIPEPTIPPIGTENIAPTKR